MGIITPTYEIWNQEEGLEGIYKQIERAGRVCYASDPIEGKAKDFVDRMIKSGHGAMLEHGTVYLLFSIEEGAKNSLHYKYEFNKYSKVHIKNNLIYITTNLRVLVENDWLEDLQYLCEPTEYHEKRITVFFSGISIGIAREFTRHRVFSFAQQSTRYCNYSKDKFEGELTFVIPSFLQKDITEGEICGNIAEFNNYSNSQNYSLKAHLFLSSCAWDNSKYLELLDAGCKPQEAREILPLTLNAPLVMTGFISDYKHFFNLRVIGTTGAPHPDAKALAEPLMNEFKQLNLI